jgi:serine O-acetyltransferase
MESRRVTWGGTKSNLQADAQRYGASGSGWAAILRTAASHRGMAVVLGYRVAHYLEMNDKHLLGAVVRRRTARVSGTDISPRAALGGGLRMPHPLGIVIGGDVVIGSNCTLMQGVTLGGNAGRTADGRSMPRLGDGVVVGPGAVVVGPCRVASGSSVPANAVVSRDFPER